MKSWIRVALCLAAAAAAQFPAPGHAEVSCTRGGLQQAVDLYLAAQTRGDLSGLPLAKGEGYWENSVPADIHTGFITKPLKIDHHRSFFDTDTCQTITELIVTDRAAPYVFSTRLRVNHDKIAEIEILWTTTGYWLFDADAYLKYSSTENWDPIPADKRSSRGTLVAAANAYLDAFLEKKLDQVPWGFPCVRVEGGAYTGKGLPSDSCEVGVPAGVNIVNRRFVVDEVLGTVSVYCTFGAGGPTGGSGPADSHLFRVENGKLRYVHTLTHLLQSDFKGNTPKPDRAAALASGSAPLVAPATPAVAAKPVDDTVGLDGRQLSLARKREGIQPAPAVRIVAGLTALQQRPGHQYYFRLDNGQVWESTDGQPDLFLRPRQTVTIRPGLLGAFFLKTEEGTSIRVHRLQ